MVHCYGVSSTFECVTVTGMFNNHGHLIPHPYGQISHLLRVTESAEYQVLAWEARRTAMSPVNRNRLPDPPGSKSATLYESIKMRKKKCGEV